MQQKVVLIVGTRPEAIKVIPLYLEFKKHPGIDAILVSTGQHREMLEQIFSFFGIMPEVNLSLMKPNQNLSELTAILFQNLSQVVSDLKPHLIFVQGDTTTAMVASLVAFYQKIQIAHLEAGLRSYNPLAPFPEEINRRIISLTANFNFAPTDFAVKNLEEEGVRHIHQVGNTVIDSLHIALKMINKNLPFYEGRFSNYIRSGKKIILITAHRRESFGEGIRNICLAIKEISEKHPECVVIFPVHLNPNIQMEVLTLLEGMENIKLLDPLTYDEMIFLMSKSFLILTDSGGVQEEAPSLNVPLLVMRKITERPEGILAGSAVLAGTDRKEIINAFSDIYCNPEKYQRMSNAPNPYGDGQTSKRIVEILLEHWSR